MNQLISFLLFLIVIIVPLKGQKNTKNEKSEKMKIEIWSDIVCPFCYIGKRHLEAALNEFPHSDEIEIIWKSFQLDPDMPKQTSKINVYKYLAERKGISEEQSKVLHENVVNMAKAVGLTYNFDKAIVANSFNAHRLIQLAKSKGLGNDTEEALFKAYFTEGKDIADKKTLHELGLSIGLEEDELNRVLNSEEFTDAVNQDIYESRTINLRGVPHFVFNDRYSLSGAQPVAAMKGALEKAYLEWKK